MTGAPNQAALRGSHRGRNGHRAGPRERVPTRLRIIQGGLEKGEKGDTPV